MAKRGPGHTSVGVSVHGVTELRDALRKVDRSLLPELRDQMRVAAESIADDTRSRVRASIKNSARSRGKAANSVRIQGSLTGGQNIIFIKAGGARVPYFGWLDFGGTLGPVGRRRNTQMRPKVRTDGAKGRYIYPARAEGIDNVLASIHDSVDTITRKAGLL